MTTYWSEDILEQVRVAGCNAESPSIYLDYRQDENGDLIEYYHCRCTICPRCNRHTSNSNQGHYWSLCKVWLREGRGINGSMRGFHFCCPDDCELEAST